MHLCTSNANISAVKVTDHFSQAKDTLVSFEILPPLKGGIMQDIFKMLDPLMEFKPPFIDVTYHREEYIYNIRDSGYYEKIAIRKRPGTVGICAAIMHHYQVDAVPHLICGGFTREETENALIDLNFLNINNVLVLRGDARKFEDKFIPEKEGHAYALDLVKQVNNMNQGKYLDKGIENGSKTNFCIGVAGYPEKHFEAPNFDTDIYYARKKVESGAAYIVTQMFFDNKKYFSYVERCRNAGITVPIVPGLKILSKKYQINSIPRKFFVDLPDALVNELMNAKTDEAVKQIGIEWCVEQCRELKSKAVPCLHFYTMGDWKSTKKTIECVF